MQRASITDGLAVIAAEKCRLSSDKQRGCIQWFGFESLPGKVKGVTEPFFVESDFGKVNLRGSVATVDQQGALKRGLSLLLSTFPHQHNAKIVFCLRKPRINLDSLAVIQLGSF